MSSLFSKGLAGLSDSKWLGDPGSAYRVVGVDYRSTPGLIKVHQKLTKISSTTVGELCKQRIAVSDGSTLWFSAESGKIWRESGGTVTLKHTTVPTSGEAKCLGAHEFEHWIYWGTESYLHRIHVDDIASTWSKYVYQNWKEFSVGDNEAHPMAEQNLDLFIGDKTVIAKVTDASTATPTQTGNMTTTLGTSVKWLAFGGRIKPREDAFSSLLVSERAIFPEGVYNASVDALVVAGGGGGGGSLNFGGGGGGAGGIVAGTVVITAGSTAITVGSGGAGGAANTNGSNGTNSSIGAIAVAVGGGGGAKGATSTAGVAGGSGGGGANSGVGGAATVGQGNDGGNGGANGGGGGGGSSAVGSAGSGANGGDGGAGTSSSISGSAVVYAAGGGGGADTGGSGGAGGTGAGNGASPSNAGGNATANRGSGGGGGGADNGTGGNGSSGIVIISYATGTVSATGGTITTSGGNTIHTFTSSGTFRLTATTLTKSVTVPPGNSKVLVALVANYSNEVPASATFGGTAMTRQSFNTHDLGGGLHTSWAVFTLADPNVTTANVVATWAAATFDMVMHVAVWDLADQTTPLTGITSNTDGIGSTSATGVGADSTLTFYTRFALTLSQTATHTIPDDQVQMEAGTNNAGNDSSSYEGVTEDYGFTAETDFNIKDPERITALETFDIDLLIGTKTPNRNRARVLRWDTASENWSAEDALDESAVNAFIRDDNYVYVSAGDYGRLYFYNGEQLLPYKRIQGDWSPTQTATVYPKAVAFLLGVPVFGLSNTTGNPALQGVYALGGYSKDYPKTLSLDFPISSGNFSGVSIGAVLVKGSDLFVAWKDGSSAGIDKLDYTAKYASAYIETMLLSSTDRGVLKTALEAEAYYASLPVNTAVTFGYKKKYDADYASVTPVTDTKLCAIRARETIPEVANLQLRFGFTVSGNTAPEIEDFACRLSPLKQ